jgi:hypothetical protein
MIYYIRDVSYRERVPVDGRREADGVVGLHQRRWAVGGPDGSASSSKPGHERRGSGPREGQAATRLGCPGGGGGDRASDIWVDLE